MGAERRRGFERGVGPRVAALFVNYNTGEYMFRAACSLWAQRIDGAPLDVELVVVDNDSPLRASDRPWLERLRDEHGATIVWSDRNDGYSGGMNRALALTTAPIVLVSNPDLLYTEGCIEEMLHVLLADPRAGTVGPRGYLDEERQIFLPINPLPTLEDEVAKFRGRFSQKRSLDYSIQRARETHRMNGSVEPSDVGMLSGASMLFRRSDVEALGLFDERFPLYYEDSDLCRRYTTAGRRVLYVPGASVTHYVSRSVSTAPKHDSPMDRWRVGHYRYFRKWYGPLGESLVRRIETEIPRHGRRAGRPATPCEDLGTIDSAPTLRFARSVPEAMVEIALDSGFYLSATAYASGDRWTFPPQAWRVFFSGVTVFVRALDTEDFSVLGTWSFATRMRPAPSP